jgi:hypothetical protein
VPTGRAERKSKQFVSQQEDITRRIREQTREKKYGNVAQHRKAPDY